jgi:alcohol dehydrogenase class IV
MDFQYFSPTQLIVSPGAVSRIGDIAASMGKKAFVALSASVSNSGCAEKLLHSLASKNIQVVEYTKPFGEPSVEMTSSATQAAKAAQCDMVISLGGGSVIDLAKAVAGLVTNGGVIEDYLEGVGAGRAVTKPGLPHIAIPTTAGAGAEVTRNAVIRSPKGRFKKSFRSPHLYPSVAILDAELSLSLPAEQTAYSGMDAITQLIESYIRKRAVPITDALAFYGLELALPAIKEVYKDGSQIEQREKMLLASTISGICLANAGLGLAHGFAAGLGALYDIPHGKACAILTPHALKFNRCAEHDKIARLGRLIADDQSLKKGEYADLIINYMFDLNKQFNIPADLSEFNIPKDEIPLLVKMSMGNSMSGNPITVNDIIAQTIMEALI